MRDEHKARCLGVVQTVVSWEYQHVPPAGFLPTNFLSGDHHVLCDSPLSLDVFISNVSSGLFSMTRIYYRMEYMTTHMSSSLSTYIGFYP